MIIDLIDKFNKYIQRLRLKKLYTNLKEIGLDVNIEKNFDIVGSNNVAIGSHVYIGPNVLIMALNADVIIGDYVMFGPNVSLITGNHRTDIVGEYMFNVVEKRPDDDNPIYINDDVWIGANATILKGVTIGEGSIIGANAIITKDIPPFSIAVGNNIIKDRFTPAELELHKRIINTKYKNREK